MEEQDCALQCAARVKRRARRDIDNSIGSADINTPKPKGRMEGWEENLEIKVGFLVFLWFLLIISI